MGASKRFPVQPAVVRWARDSAGFSPAQAALALGVGVPTQERLGHPHAVAEVYRQET